jgi:polysaccharide biosynthesis/export protein
VLRPLSIILPATTLLLSAQVALAQQAVPAAALKAPERPYTINPGDELEVYVWGEERLQRTIRVLPDGTFAFPLVGRVVAQGLLPTQIEAALASGLSSQYRGQPPQVTVSVRVPSGYVVSVIGRVRSASTFTPGRYINVLEAVAMAGGPDEFANLDNITIIRKADRSFTTIKVRLGGAMKGNLSTEAARSIPTIESGDTVIVP